MLAVFDSAVDVLQYDNGVVHHHPDRQHKSQQGQQIHAVTQHVHDDKRSDQGNRHRKRRNHGSAEASKEQEDDQKHENCRHDQRVFHFGNRSVDEAGLVAQDTHRHAFRQILFQFPDQGTGAGRNGQRIRRRLLIDADADHRLFVRGKKLTLVAGIHGNRRHIPQSDVIAVAVALEHHVPEILRGIILAFQPYDKFTLGRFDPPAGIFHILGKQSFFDIGNRNPARRHGGPVQPDAHGLLLPAENAGVRHAFDHGKPVDQIAVGIIGQFHAGHAGAGQSNDHDRRAGGVILGNDGRIRLVRQFAQDTADAVPHVVCGGVDIAVHGKFKRHSGPPVLAGGFDGIKPLDPRHGTFDDLRDLRLHDTCRGTVILRGNGDRRHIDIRVFAHRHVAQPDQSEDNQDQHQYDGRHRADDGKRTDRHCAASFLSMTGDRSASFRTPSVTITSPAFSPPVTSTLPPSRLPRRTTRRDTFCLSLL